MTDRVVAQFSNGKSIYLPSDFHKRIGLVGDGIANAEISDCKTGLVTTVAPNVPLTLNLVPRPINTLEVVYFIACDLLDDWKDFLFANLGYLAPLRGEARFRLHVCANVRNRLQADELRQEVHLLGFDSTFSFCYENRFEWVGIDRVHQIAREANGSIVLYFHSKGISHAEPNPYFMYRPRALPDAPIGLCAVFERFSEVVNIFETFTCINNVAAWISNSGKGWHNFWWSRSSYLASLGPVKIVREMKDRYYYERWLGKGLANDEVSVSYWRSIANRGYNLDCRKPNIGAFFHPDETLGPLRRGAAATRMT